jgi:hypothetical protein
MNADGQIRAVVTGVAVVIVVAVLIFVPFEIIESHNGSLHPLSTLHIGIVSDSQVNNTSGVGLNEIPATSSIFSSQSSEKPIKAIAASFVRSSGYGELIMGSFEFLSQSSASSFVAQIYENAMIDLQGYQQGVGFSVAVTNESFNNFRYTAIVLGGTFGNNSGAGSMVLIVAGYSGQFAFAMDVYHIAISNPSALVHDEILTMTA